MKTQHLTGTAVAFGSLIAGSLFSSHSLSSSELNAKATAWHVEHQQPSEGVAMTHVLGDQVTYASAGVKGEGRELVDEKTLFEIGSITKVFTGILLADAVLQGKAELDDPITQHLPEGWVGDDSALNSITLLELSTHTSGLPRLPANLQDGATQSDPYAHYDRDRLVQYLEQFDESQFEQKGEFAYSNLGVGLLGEILGEIYHSSYSDLLQTVIFDPLGMDNSFLQVEENSIPESHKDLFATGHHGGDPVSYWRLASLSAAGAIVTDSVDLAKFAKANWSDATPERLKKAMKLAATAQTDRMGLGWFVAEDGTLSHGGGTGGFRTHLKVDITKQTADIELKNSAGEKPRLEPIGDIAKLAGYWLGTLQAGPQKLRLVLHVAENEQSSVYSLDQGCSIISSTGSTLEGDDFVFKFSTIGASFKGKFEDGKLIGKWNQGGEMALEMVALDSMFPDLKKVFKKRYKGELDSLVGWWSGMLGGEEGIPVLLEVINHTEDDCFEVRGWSPSQTPAALTISSTQFDGKKLILKADQIKGKYEAVLDPESRVLTGTWTQGQENPLVLTYSKKRPEK